jgi:HPt (histidine-containing phosphotransfer) domain-containing protein
MAEMLDFPAAVAEKVASPPLAPDVPAIDRAHLFRMTLGDHSLECEVLQLFDQQAGLLLARMGEADPAGIAALAHTLQGSARGVGAWGIARAAEALEVAARSKTAGKAGGKPGGGLQSAMKTLAVTTEEARRAIAELLRT